MTESSEIAEIDAMVVAIDPGGRTGPGVETCDVVLVTGPWLAGTTSLVAALRRRCPDVTLVEAGELDPGQAPAAVVFVVSAVAPVTESDCALFDAAAANTDLVVAALSKVDAHHNWRDILAANRQALAGHDPRYADTTWVAVSVTAAEPGLDELADVLGRERAEPTLAQRNRLRAWQSRLRADIRCREDEAAGVGREARMAALREQRKAALRQRRRVRSERTLGFRSRISQARMQLTQFARNRCSSVGDELAEDAMAVTRRRLPRFCDEVQRRVTGVVEEVNAGTFTHLSQLALDLGLRQPPVEPAPAAPAVSPPQLRSRPLEHRLMMLLGAGFGLGVGLTLSRVFADLAPGYTAAGLVAGALVGLVGAALLVGTRGRLHDQAVLDRWVAGVLAEVQSVVEHLVAERVLQAETAMALEQDHQLDAGSARVAEQVADIDSELREHAVAAARASAARDEDLPALHRALHAVEAALNRGGTERKKRKAPSKDSESFL